MLLVLPRLAPGDRPGRRLSDLRYCRRNSGLVNGVANWCSSLYIDFASIEQRNNPPQQTPSRNTPPKTPSKWFSRGNPPVSREFELPFLLHSNGSLATEAKKQTGNSRCGLFANRVDLVPENSYNRYLAVASRVVRRSLKDDKRVAAERRGDMDLRFAKWEVSLSRLPYHRSRWKESEEGFGTPILIDFSQCLQNGKMGEVKDLASANAAATVEAANSGGS